MPKTNRQHATSHDDQTAILNDVLIGNVKILSRYQFYAIVEGDTHHYRNPKKVADIAADLNRHIREKTNIGRFIQCQMPQSLGWMVVWW